MKYEYRKNSYWNITESWQTIKAGEIAEITGIDKKDVSKAIKTLKAEEKIISPKNCYYTVK